MTTKIVKNDGKCDEFADVVEKQKKKFDLRVKVNEKFTISNSLKNALKIVQKQQKSGKILCKWMYKPSLPSQENEVTIIYLLKMERFVRKNQVANLTKMHKNQEK